MKQHFQGRIKPPMNWIDKIVHLESNLHTISNKLVIKTCISTMARAISINQEWMSQCTKLIKIYQYPDEYLLYK